ncbi:universal stress protein [Nitrosovibrio sp. Nv17]|uniref:universal stress protein n=1 Tax=Nitrosovibrio sp. Nv17 TaxID=1855339 RepID=UPI0009086A84|nr:universal stress protein [Nitrosovibrio sp. Nv17]SFW13024.1 Nucleotide-binding universal stress protein, UspA family [Nitrosovibrio sp. Nv17]
MSILDGAGPILVATDLSERSLRAATRAALLCAELGRGEVELLAVKEAKLPDALALVLGSTLAAAESMLVGRTLEELRPISRSLQENHGIRCTSSVRFGRPGEAIAARAVESSAVLTVIGMHGGGFFTELFVGNTADELSRASRTPLLVVRNAASHAYREVLVPVDFSEDSRHAALEALRIAPSAHVTFLHVFDIVLEEQMRCVNAPAEAVARYGIRAREAARAELHRFVGGLGLGDRACAHVVVFGNPGHAVCDHARTLQPDLIALGKHGRRPIENLLLGSVTRHALERAGCDVLIVTAPAAA